MFDQHTRKIQELLQMGDPQPFLSHEEECPLCQEHRQLVDELADQSNSQAYNEHAEQCPICLQQANWNLDASDSVDDLVQQADFSQEEETTPSASQPQIPGYKILEKIGKGGMGVVYKAYQNDLRRIVALKTIRKDIQASPKERMRFRREAEAVAKLQHPHIAQIFEIGEHDKTLFYAMEYMPGGSLQDWLDDEQLPSYTRVAEMVRTMAEAMDHAHENDIIHRDLKPGNILLDKFGTPKIGDFLFGQTVGQTPSTHGFRETDWNGHPHVTGTSTGQ